MGTIGTVQRRILKVEGFQVRFRHLNGKDVHDRMDGIPQYPYVNMAKNAWSVTYWRSQRFKANYPGFKVDVLRKDGSPSNGHSLLGNVRDSYLDQ